MVKFIVSDWNGTINRDSEEIRTRSAIIQACKDRFVRQAKHLSPFAAFKLAKLVKAEDKLKDICQKIKSGETDADELYRVFNEAVVSGMRKSPIHSAINGIPIISSDIDSRIMDPLDVMKKNGTQMGILSAAYEYGIKDALLKSWHKDVFIFQHNRFLNIVGDKLLDQKGIDADILPDDCRVSGFELKIYGNKSHFLEYEFARRRGFRDIIYIGDSADDLDCFDYATSNGGRAIISLFLAEKMQSDRKVAEFVKMCTEKFDAFVPKDGGDFLHYLERS